AVSPPAARTASLERVLQRRRSRVLNRPTPRRSATALRRVGEAARPDADVGSRRSYPTPALGGWPVARRADQAPRSGGGLPAPRARLIGGRGDRSRCSAPRSAGACRLGGDGI